MLPVRLTLTALVLATGLAACQPAPTGTAATPRPSSGPALPPAAAPPTTITWGATPAVPVMPSDAPSAAAPLAPTFGDDFRLSTPAGWRLTAKDEPGSGYTRRLTVAAQPGDRGAGEASVLFFGGIDPNQDPAALTSRLQTFVADADGATIGAERRVNQGEIGGFAFTMPGNLQGQGYGWLRDGNLFLVTVVGDGQRLTDAAATAIARSFAPM